MCVASIAMLRILLPPAKSTTGPPAIGAVCKALIDDQYMFLSSTTILIGAFGPAASCFGAATPNGDDQTVPSLCVKYMMLLVSMNRPRAVVGALKKLAPKGVLI